MTEQERGKSVVKLDGRKVTIDGHHVRGVTDVKVEVSGPGDYGFHTVTLTLIPASVEVVNASLNPTSDIQAGIMAAVTETDIKG